MDDYRDDYEVSDYSDFYDVKPPKRHSFLRKGLSAAYC